MSVSLQSLINYLSSDEATLVYTALRDADASRQERSSDLDLSLKGEREVSSLLPASEEPHSTHLSLTTLHNLELVFRSHLYQQLTQEKISSLPEEKREGIINNFEELKVTITKSFRVEEEGKQFLEIPFYNVLTVKEKIELREDITTHSQTYLLFLVLNDEQYSRAWLYCYIISSLISREISLILPIQNRIEKVKFDGNMLFATLLSNIYNTHAYKVINKYRIGSHTQVKDGVLSTVKKLRNVSPYQIYISNSRSYEIEIHHDMLNSIFQNIVQHGTEIFVHSPLGINLCTSYDVDGRNLACLSRCLDYAAKMGMKGVVVHVGKLNKDKIKRDFNECMNNFRNNILAALEYATEQCPLLLETPAGQGSETLTVAEDFIGFVKSFSTRKFQVCCDTCHVNSLGYMPTDYINRLVAADMPPKLIHYNDSERHFGARVDRHALIGSGTIGYDEMTRVAVLATSLSIPMVIE